MANFKRKKPRTRTFGKRYDKWKAKRLKNRNNGYYWWMGSYPKWHDIVYHTRPRRAKIKGVERKLMAGADADGLPFPLSKKPHRYYW